MTLRVLMLGTHTLAGQHVQGHAIGCTGQAPAHTPVLTSCNPADKAPPSRAAGNINKNSCEKADKAPPACAAGN
jgi:hypothetical protein